MALSDISLTAGMRQNLLALQSTASLLDRTQSRLSSGKKVNTALDNPTNFFSAQANTQRANDLSTRKDGMSEAVQGVQAANQGITAITSLIEAAKGLTQAAASADTTNRNALAGQYNQVLNQISKLASDSGYKGKNFLTGDSLSVLFNENGGSSLTINGFDSTSKGLGIQNLTIASATTIGFSGKVSGTANVAIHKATLDSTLAGGFAASTRALGTPKAVNDTTVTTGVSGIASGSTFTFSTTGIAGASGNTLYTGAVTVNAVYANGVDVTSLFSKFTLTQGAGSVAMTVSGGVGGLLDVLHLNGQPELTTTSGVVITLDTTIGAHSVSGQKIMAGGNQFLLQAGDVKSGLSILTGSKWNGPAGSAVAGQTHTGLAVFVDGVFKAQGQGWKIAQDSDNRDVIQFATGIVPPNAKVTYAYNSGYVSSAANGGGKLIYGGADKFTISSYDAKSMSISNVKLDGNSLSGSQFNLASDGTLTIAAGLKNTAFGSKLTYDLTTRVSGSWDTNAGIDNSVNQLNTAIDTLRTQSANLASNLNVVTIRQDFTDGMVATLQKGADNLTLADMNQEGANMLMLQTRQQLGTTSLKMASDAAQSVLRLF
jgi:flagellin